MMPAAAVKVSNVRTSPKKAMNNITPNYFYEQRTTYHFYRFPIPSNISVYSTPEYEYIHLGK